MRLMVLFRTCPPTVRPICASSPVARMAVVTSSVPLGAPSRLGGGSGRWCVVSSGAADRTARRPASGARVNRLLPVALLVLGLLAVGGVALSGGGGEDGGPDPTAVEAPSATEAQSKQPKPTPAPEESAPEELSGAALHGRVFGLIEQGRYEEAMPILERAVGSFGEGSSDLSYAYALFNLGHALRMAGRPEEAIPILEQRLEIPNQRGAVRRELEAAIAAVDGDGGEGVEQEDEGGPPHGKAKGHDKHD